MTVEEKAYGYASKLVKNRLTASEVAAHYGRGYIEGQADMKQLGWHPASERPVIPKGKCSVNIIAYCITPSGIYTPIKFTYTKIGKWLDSIEWWCYPPKED